MTTQMKITDKKTNEYMHGGSSLQKGTVMNPSAFMSRIMRHYVLLRDSSKRKRVPVETREPHVCLQILNVSYFHCPLKTTNLKRHHFHCPLKTTNLTSPFSLSGKITEKNINLPVYKAMQIMYNIACGFFSHRHLLPWLSW